VYTVKVVTDHFIAVNGNDFWHSVNTFELYQEPTLEKQVADLEAKIKEVKEKLTALKKQKAEQEEVTYRFGQRFRKIGYVEDYILAQVAPFSVCLINLDTGHRFTDPVVVNSVYKITQEEFKKLSDRPGKFTLIN
jgi:hypothetical protein